jgi:hypothetical protein
MPKDNSKSFEHGLANRLTPMRIRLEKFLLDYADGRFKNNSDHENLKKAMDLIRATIVQVDNIFEHLAKTKEILKK